MLLVAFIDTVADHVEQVHKFWQKLRFSFVKILACNHFRFVFAFVIPNSRFGFKNLTNFCPHMWPHACTSNPHKLSLILISASIANPHSNLHSTRDPISPSNKPRRSASCVRSIHSFRYTSFTFFSVTGRDAAWKKSLEVSFSRCAPRLSNKTHNLSGPFKIHFTQFPSRSFHSAAFSSDEGLSSRELLLWIALTEADCKQPLIVCKLRSKVRTSTACLTEIFRPAMMSCVLATANKSGAFDGKLSIPATEWLAIYIQNEMWCSLRLS